MHPDEEKATSTHLCENWKETDDYCYLCAPKDEEINGDS